MASLLPPPLPPQDTAELAKEHAYTFLPANTAYQQAETLGVRDAAVDALNAQQAAWEKEVKA